MLLDSPDQTILSALYAVSKDRDGAVVLEWLRKSGELLASKSTRCAAQPMGTWMQGGAQVLDDLSKAVKASENPRR